MEDMVGVLNYEVVQDVQLTGTVETDGSEEVYGTGTLFQDELSEGDWIYIENAGGWWEVTSIGSQTFLIVNADIIGPVGGAGDIAKKRGLPASIPVGKVLLYNGTLWRGLLEKESSLPAGTPWPCKGYKEVICSINQDGTDDPIVVFLIHSDIGDNIALTRYGVGSYSFLNLPDGEVLLNDMPAGGRMVIWDADGEGVGYLAHGGGGDFNTYDATVNPADSIMASQDMRLTIYPPPPA